jgi:hypothetical protein
VGVEGEGLEGARNYPPGYNKVLFLVDQELIEIRLVDGMITTAQKVARELKARFFFKAISVHHERKLVLWGAYDSRRRAGGASSKWGVTIEPQRTFVLPVGDDKLDGPVMWAMAVGAGTGGLG